MELKFFNKENSSISKDGESIVRINTKAGLISFSKAATLLLGIGADTKLSFAQDSKSKVDWYIFTDPDKGFKMRVSPDSAGSDFNSTPLAKSIIDSVNTKLVACGFKIQKTPVEIEGTNYYLIITANPLNPNMK